MGTMQLALSCPSPLWGGSPPIGGGVGCFCFSRAKPSTSMRRSAKRRATQVPHSAITKRTRSQAHGLRQKPTDAERKLWYLLRSLKPLGLHFRRQAPIGVYIADFVWHTGKLVIELDGSQYAEARAAYDAGRTACLQSQGYRVIRFWNNDVLRSPSVVGEAILAAARETSDMAEGPTPNHSPQGGGERAATSGEDAS